MKKNESTQGEDLIADFFDEKGILYKRYVKISGLKDDSKIFREADFYLPDYKVYLEFLGQWNNFEHKKRYKEKIGVYYKNNIPCIYIWPDNLGTLDWMFKRRLRETLLKNNKTWGLIKFEWSNFTEEFGVSFLLFVALIYLVDHKGWKISLMLFLVYTVYTWISKYLKRLRSLKKSRWVSNNK